MMMRKPRYRRFDYTPRYYDPMKDESERKRRRIKFERNTNRGSHRPMVFIVAALVLVYLLYTYMN